MRSINIWTLYGKICSEESWLLISWKIWLNSYWERSSGFFYCPFTTLNDSYFCLLIILRLTFWSIPFLTLQNSNTFTHLFCSCGVYCFGWWSWYSRGVVVMCRGVVCLDAIAVHITNWALIQHSKTVQSCAAAAAVYSHTDTHVGHRHKHKMHFPVAAEWWCWLVWPET